MTGCSSSLLRMPSSFSIHLPFLSLPFCYEPHLLLSHLSFWSMIPSFVCFSVHFSMSTLTTAMDSGFSTGQDGWSRDPQCCAACTFVFSFICCCLTGSCSPHSPWLFVSVPSPFCRSSSFCLVPDQSQPSEVDRFVHRS